MCQLFQDWGIDMQAKVWIDSSAALGAIHRKGNGRLRHVRVGMHWIQERVEEGGLEVAKVKGKENPADLMTKHLTKGVMEGHLEGLKQELGGGRAGASLKL